MRRRPFCLANPLASYLWKLSGLQNLISKCVVLDIHHCAFGSHWRKAARLLFGGLSDRACVHVLSSYVFDATENTVFVAAAKDTKHLLLQGSLARQSAKYPPRLLAFISGLLMDP